MISDQRAATADAGDENRLVDPMRIQRVGIWLVCIGLLGLAGTTFRRPNTSPEVIVLALCVVGLLIGIWLVVSDGWRSSAVRIGAAATSMAVVAVLAAPALVPFFQIRVFVVTTIVAVALAALALLRPAISRTILLACTFVAVATFSIGALSVLGGEAPPIDVVELHEQAVVALNAGENPYSTGSVSVYESLPQGGGETIQEYTYPPINLAWYWVGDAISGDVRAGGAIAIALAFVLVGLIGLQGPETRVAPTVAVLGLLLANQAHYLMVSNGWTEAVAVPFFLASLLLWKKVPMASAVLLGLALASKQYFILAIPVVLVLPDSRRYMRAGVASVVAALTFLPFVLWDVRGLIDGVIVHHLTRTPRPDGMTLANLGIEVPTVLALAAAVGVGVLLGRRARGGGSTLLSLSAVFSVFTILAVRGFINTWWMVFWLVAAALLVPDWSSATIDEDAAGSSTDAQRQDQRMASRGHAHGDYKAG
ncbi:MAG: hypothetical protein ACR2N2_07510 [Acidimicrobiia bacterium]